jgi:hypothetical protein
MNIIILLLVIASIVCAFLALIKVVTSVNLVAWSALLLGIALLIGNFTTIR